MKNILCYGDSNTWGATPETFERYPWGVRWPSILQHELGTSFHISENALNGRTTVFEDYVEEGRCGKYNFEVILEQNNPLDLIIIMLGTNDVKKRFSLPVWDIGWGIDLLIKYVRRYSINSNGECPEILIVSPIILGSDWSKTILGTVFDQESTSKSTELFSIYSEIAKRNKCHIFNAAEFAQPGSDCVHITEAGHLELGKAISLKVKEILA